MTLAIALEVWTDDEEQGRSPEGNDTVDEDEPDFFQKGERQYQASLAFNDGIYNFETKQLEPFEQKYRFFYKLPWDYGVIDQSLAAEIASEYWIQSACEDPSHPDYEEQRKTRDYCMKVLARASAGEINDKTFHLHLSTSATVARRLDRTSQDGVHFWQFR